MNSSIRTREVPGSSRLPAMLMTLSVVGSVLGGGAQGTACAQESACAQGSACGLDPASGQEPDASSCPATNCCSGSGCGKTVPEVIRIDPAIRRVSPEETGPTHLRLLDDALERIRARHRTPALVAAVWKGDRVIAGGATGVRSAGSPTPVAMGDRFHFGSCGKAATATIAGILVESGALSWSTTIEDVFPELSVKLREEYRAVTLRQLLSHRSGVPQGRPAELSLLEGPLPKQRRELVAVIGRLEPVAMPGATFHYSDLGYCVAGAMLEKVTGESWETLVVERIAKPLGLESIGFGAPGTASDSQPWGHVLVGDLLQGVAPGPGADGAAAALGPAGTIHASVSDWAAFAALQIDGRGTASTTLLGPQTRLALHADRYGQGYALGWGLQPTDTGSDLVHSGSCGRWAAVVRVSPASRTAIVVASNYGGGNAFQAVAEALDLLVEQYGVVE